MFRRPPRKTRPCATQALTAAALLCALPLLLAAPAQAQLKYGQMPKAFAATTQADSPEQVAADRTGAEAGKADAQFALGARLMDGRGLPRDNTQARLWLGRATEQNHAGAQYRLGLMHRTGLGGPVNLAEAGRLMLLAANQGNGPAQFELAEMWATGQMGASSAETAGNKNGIDKEEALRWYRAAGTQGNAEALFRAGTMLLAEDQVRKSDAEAFDLFQLAARRGHAKAMYNLSVLYSQGRGTKRDTVRAAKYCRLAAGLGVVEAEHTLGMLLLRGEGVLQDRDEGLRWLRVASAAGYAPAKTQLALAESAKRFEKDLPAATAHLRQSARSGDAKARLNLGMLYATGAGGLKKDPAQAHAWLSLAAQDGESMAALQRDAVAKTLTKAELARSQELVRELTPQPLP